MLHTRQLLKKQVIKMAFTPLKTDYVNDQLNTTVNTNVKYVMTDNGDGTVSLEDATAYTQQGDSFDASILNNVDATVNAIGTQVTTNTADVANLLDGKVDINTSASTGTTDGDLYAAIVALGWESDVIE